MRLLDVTFNLNFGWEHIILTVGIGVFIIGFGILYRMLNRFLRGIHYNKINIDVINYGMENHPIEEVREGYKQRRNERFEQLRQEDDFINRQTFGMPVK